MWMNTFGMETLKRIFLKVLFKNKNHQHHIFSWLNENLCLCTSFIKCVNCISCLLFCRIKSLYTWVAYMYTYIDRYIFYFGILQLSNFQKIIVLNNNTNYPHYSWINIPQITMKREINQSVLLCGLHHTDCRLK